jgi:hypothetical protein
MKQISMFALSLVLLGSTSSNGLAQDKSDTYAGEILDQQCAQMGSHDNMMKSEGAKNAKECTLACVKNGGAFALLDSRTKKVYPIEDGKKVSEYAGERVQITGSFDESANVLHVKSVTRAH